MTSPLLREKKGRNEQAAKHKPLYGYLFMLASMLFGSMSDMSSKLLFMYQPKFNIYFFILIRAIFQQVLFGLAINKQAKVVLWDCISRKTIFPMFLVMIAMSYLYYAFYVSLSMAPMMLVSTTGNLTPVIVVVLATIFLGEKITIRDIVCLFGAMLGIYILILGG